MTSQWSRFLVSSVTTYTHTMLAVLNDCFMVATYSTLCPAVGLSVFSVAVRLDGVEARRPVSPWRLVLVPLPHILTTDHQACTKRFASIASLPVHDVILQHFRHEARFPRVPIPHELEVPLHAGLSPGKCILKLLRFCDPHASDVSFRQPVTR